MPEDFPFRSIDSRDLRALMQLMEITEGNFPGLDIARDERQNVHVYLDGSPILYVTADNWKKLQESAHGPA